MLIYGSGERETNIEGISSDRLWGMGSKDSYCMKGWGVDTFLSLMGMLAASKHSSSFVLFSRWKCKTLSFYRSRNVEREKVCESERPLRKGFTLKEGLVFAESFAHLEGNELGDLVGFCETSKFSTKSLLTYIARALSRCECLYIINECFTRKLMTRVNVGGRSLARTCSRWSINVFSVRQFICWSIFENCAIRISVSLTKNFNDQIQW